MGHPRKSEPLACPFCGARQPDVGRIGWDFAVTCNNCTARGPVILGDVKDAAGVREAVKQWNRRI